MAKDSKEKKENKGADGNRPKTPERCQYPVEDYTFGEFPWTELPLVYLPCPHRHFRTEVINRDMLTPDQHISLLATPKGYRWNTDTGMPETTRIYYAKSKKRCHIMRTCKGTVTKWDQRYIHDFLSEIWNLLTPDMIERLKKMLMDEFGMSLREAEEFIAEQKIKGAFAKKKPCGTIQLGIRHQWIKEFTRILSCKITDYVVMMLCTRRTQRTRIISEILNGHFGDITGEQCAISNPSNRVQRIQVFAADRIAVWLAGIMAETDKELCKEFVSKAGTLGSDEGSGAGGRPPAKPRPAKPKPSGKPQEDVSKPMSPEKSKEPKPSSPPGSKPPSKPPSQAGSKPTSPTGSKPTSQAGSKPPSQAGSKPPSQAGSKPTTPTGSKPPSQPTSKPPSQPTSKPPSQAGSKPPSQAGSKPTSPTGSKPPSQPTSKPPSQPTSKPPSQPTSKPPSQPTSKPSSEPTSKPPSQPTSKPPSQPTSKPPSQPTSKPASQPTSKPTSQPTSKPPSKPASPAVSKPSSQVGSKSSQPGSKHEVSKPSSETEVKTPSKAPSVDGGSKPPSKPPSSEASKHATPAGSKPATPTGSKPGTPKGSKPATPTGSKPATPVGSKPSSMTGSGKEIGINGVSEELVGDEGRGTGTGLGAGAGGEEEGDLAGIIAGAEGADTDLQGVLVGVIGEELKDEFGEEPGTTEAIDRVSDKVSSWMDDLICEAEKDIDVMATVPPSVLASRKMTFLIKKHKGHYDVNRIDSKTAFQKTKEARASRVPVAPTDLCWRPKEGPVKPEEMKEWSQWAAGVVNLAEEWANWIEKTCQEAEKKAGEPIDVENLRKWLEKTRVFALEYRRNKQYLKGTADLWKEKVEKKPK